MNDKINLILNDSKIGDITELQLHNAEQNQLASVALTKQARRYLDIVSHNLDRKIYDNEEFSDAVKVLATSNPKAKIRLLIHDSETIVKQGHRLIELARRLSSYIEIRIQGKRFKEFNEAWLIVDSKAWIQRPFSDTYVANIDYSAARQLKETSKIFDDMWNEASNDPNLRRLNI